MKRVYLETRRRERFDISRSIDRGKVADAVRVARETDCPFRRVYGVRNEPQETVTRAKMDRTFEVG